MANEVMCPYCGEMISDKATVCRHCGRILSGSVKYDADGTGAWYGDAPDGYTGEEAQRMRRRSHTAFWLVIALCTLLFVGFIALFAIFAVRFAQTAVENPDEIESFIAEITNTDPTEIAGSGDIGTLPDLPGGVVSDQMNLIIDYVEALEKNDLDAMAAVFHPAILESYDSDVKAMVSDLDEHYPQYGMKLSGWTTVDSEAVGADDVAELNDALPVGIENAEVHLIELTGESGSVIEVYLLLVQTAEGWSLYYSY